MENSKSTFKAFDIDSMLDSLEDQLEEESSSEKRAKEAIANIPTNSSSSKAESHNNKEGCYKKRKKSFYVKEIAY